MALTCIFHIDVSKRRMGVHDFIHKSKNVISLVISILCETFCIRHFKYYILFGYLKKRNTRGLFCVQSFHKRKFFAGPQRILLVNCLRILCLNTILIIRKILIYKRRGAEELNINLMFYCCLEY